MNKYYKNNKRTSWHGLCHIARDKLFYVNKANTKQMKVMHVENITEKEWDDL